MPQDNSTISGFIVQNNHITEIPMGLVVNANSVTIINCQFSYANHHVGIYVRGGGAGSVIANNLIQNNGSVGICFVNGSGGSTKIEGNVITHNAYGVEFDDPSTGDLGGGSTGSTGGNTIAHNSVNNLWTNCSDGTTIHAQNNAWDHSPPTTGPGSGYDIFNPNGATIVTTGSTTAP